MSVDPQYRILGSIDRIRKVVILRDKQGKRPDVETDEYVRGVYNGLEMALATMQEQDPQYKRRRN